MMLRKFMCVWFFLSGGTATVTAQPNPYCITGADWRPNNSRMVALDMPGGLGDESGSLGYFWGRFREWNIPAMSNPCYRSTSPPFNCFDTPLDPNDYQGTIYDEAAVQQWVLDNPGHIYIIGNEPDNFDLAAGDGVSPQKYAHMYQTYHEFIAPLDATARFAVAGLVAGTDAASFNADINWWNQVLTHYKSTFGEDMPIDIWNCHAYTSVGKLNPERIINEFFIPYRAYVDTVSGGIYADKPLWCTEYGIAMWSTPLSPSYQAEFIQQLCPRLEKEYLLPTGETKRVCDRFFWFLGPYETTWRDSAMLDQSNQPTVVGTTYSQLANTYPNPVPPLPGIPPSPAGTISSDFATDASPWKVMAGDWAVDSGEYRQTRVDGPWGLRTHLPYWYRNFRIEADMKINAASDPSNWVAFNLRGGTIWEGNQMRAYLIFLRQNGELAIHTAEDGTVASLPGAVPDTSVFHRIGVTAFDSRIEVSIDGQSVLTWNDPNARFSEGLTALEAGRTDCSFDNVTVIPLCDFDADRDDVCDGEDNCIAVVNPDQEDGDADGVGDACDLCPDTPAGDLIDSVGCSLPIPGDMDQDRDVDIDDFGLFQVCFSGDGHAQTQPSCAAALIDGDDDVDQFDLTLLLGCMSGPGIESDQLCAP